MSNNVRDPDSAAHSSANCASVQANMLNHKQKEPPVPDLEQEIDESFLPAAPKQSNASPKVCGFFGALVRILG